MAFVIDRAAVAVCIAEPAPVIADLAEHPGAGDRADSGKMPRTNLAPQNRTLSSRAG
jgi:hypothetical protein